MPVAEEVISPCKMNPSAVDLLYNFGAACSPVCCQRWGGGVRHSRCFTENCCLLVLETGLMTVVRLKLNLLKQTMEIMIFN